MSYLAIYVDNLILCKWEDLNVEDCDRLAKEIESRYQICNKPLIIFSLFKENVSVPSSEFRNRCVQLLNEKKEYFEKMVNVLPGDNLKNTIVRTAASTMMLVSSERKKLLLSDTLENALESSKSSLPRSYQEIMKIAKENNMI